MARSLHDPGKTALDLVVAIALGGDCLADAAVVRAQPEVFGTVASDPTIAGSSTPWAMTRPPRLIGARAAARSTVWDHRSPVLTTGPVVVDLDATLVGAHSGRKVRPRTSSGASGPPHVCLR